MLLDLSFTVIGQSGVKFYKENCLEAAASLSNLQISSDFVSMLSRPTAQWIGANEICIAAVVSEIHVLSDEQSVHTLQVYSTP